MIWGYRQPKWFHEGFGYIVLPIVGWQPETNGKEVTEWLRVNWYKRTWLRYDGNAMVRWALNLVESLFKLINYTSIKGLRPKTGKKLGEEIHKILKSQWPLLKNIMPHHAAYGIQHISISCNQRFNSQRVLPPPPTQWLSHVAFISDTLWTTEDK